MITIQGKYLQVHTNTSKGIYKGITDFKEVVLKG